MTPTENFSENLDNLCIHLFSLYAFVREQNSLSVDFQQISTASVINITASDYTVLFYIQHFYDKTENYCSVTEL